MFLFITAPSPRPSGTGSFLYWNTGAEAPAYYQSASPRRHNVGRASSPVTDRRSRPSDCRKWLGIWPNSSEPLLEWLARANAFAASPDPGGRRIGTLCALLTGT